MAELANVSGETIAGRFSIIRELGRGGMAVVLLARDLEADRLVAVKMLREDIASAVNTERFLREVGVAGGLSHPRILQVLHSGRTSAGLPFYVMPYVEGETLRQRLSRVKQLPVDDAIVIVRQIADALAAAHEHGVLHRDVTPANVLLAGNDAYLSDFGIARALVVAEGQTLTSTGIVIGTPEYMSPEQGAGDHGMDARGDLYSLASLLYACLAGEPPYTGPSPQAVLARKATSRAPSVHELRPTVPAHVARAIARALEPVPADRFNSVREFDDALITEDAPPAAHRSRRTWWLAACAVGAVLGMGGFAMAMSRNSVESAERALRGGRVSESITRLRQAVQRDSADANAALWLSQALVLAGQDTTAEWRRATQMAVAGASQLTRNGAARAGALLALADRKFGLACDQFRSLSRSEPKDMTLVFDLAECLGRDGGVVSDSGSPSRWRFRASREETTGLYQSLLEQLPVGHEERITVFRHLSPLVIAEWEQLRSGASIDDSTQRFAAYPELMSASGRDTIAYVPQVMSVMSYRTLGPARERAIEHNRGMLRNVGTAWASEQPHVVDSHLALSRALELAGELSGGSAGAPTALSEIRAARTYASSPLEVLRLRSAELRIQVKNGEFAAARAMADSAILSIKTPDRAARALLAPMLALTGRARALANLLAVDAATTDVRMPDGHAFRPHPVLATTAFVFSAYAQVGGPRDSIIAVRERGERQLRSYASSQAQDSVRTALFAQSISLAVPVIGLASALSFTYSGKLVQAQQTLARGDRTATLAQLDSARQRRAGPTAASVQVSQVFQEAWLRAAAGDSSGAIRQLDDAFGGLPARGTLFLRIISEAAAIGRGMRLRGELAQRRGDVEDAQRWLRRAKDLLDGADPELRP